MSTVFSGEVLVLVASGLDVRVKLSLILGSVVLPVISVTVATSGYDSTSVGLVRSKIDGRLTIDGEVTLKKLSTNRELFSSIGVGYSP